MISGAVRRNEINGDLPEVTLAIRNTSAVAYGGKYAWWSLLPCVDSYFSFNTAASETVSPC